MTKSKFDELEIQKRQRNSINIMKTNMPYIQHKVELRNDEIFDDSSKISG